MKTNTIIRINPIAAAIMLSGITALHSQALPLNLTAGANSVSAMSIGGALSGVSGSFSGTADMGASIGITSGLDALSGLDSAGNDNASSQALHNLAGAGSFSSVSEAVAAISSQGDASSITLPGLSDLSTASANVSAAADAVANVSASIDDIAELNATLESASSVAGEITNQAEEPSEEAATEEAPADENNETASDEAAADESAPAEEVASENSADEPDTAETAPSSSNDGLIASVTTAVSGNGSITGKLQGIGEQAAELTASLTNSSNVTGDWGPMANQPEASETNDNADPETTSSEDDAQETGEDEVAENSDDSTNPLSAITDAAAQQRSEIANARDRARNIDGDVSYSSSFEANANGGGSIDETANYYADSSSASESHGGVHAGGTEQ